MDSPKKLMISGFRHSGKTAFSLSLALLLRDQGLKVGYFKPLGWQTFVKEQVSSGKQLGYFMDADAHLMKEVLKLEQPMEYIVPVLINFNYLTSMAKETDKALEKRIEEAYRRVSEGVDILLIEGGHIPQLFYSRKLSTYHLAKKFDAKFLMVGNVRSDLPVDDLIFRKAVLDLLNINCIGTVINNVPRISLQRTKGVIKPLLEKNSLKVWGVIEENREITSPTVADIQDIVEGEILETPEKLDLDSILVEDFLIGSMTYESAIKYFRRSINKAVIMGGDRDDIALAALKQALCINPNR